MKNSFMLWFLPLSMLCMAGSCEKCDPTEPTVSTSDISAVAANTAIAGGDVTSDGGAAVTERGVCWNTSAGPTIANNPTSGGSGLGTFRVTLSPLVPGVTYYYRAYATNSVGTGYGLEVPFTTSAIPSTITTTPVTAITTISATSGGTINSDGGGAIAAKGVCWSTTINPTIANNKTSDGTGTGIFNSSLTSLTANTTYYVRAYATNSAGTAYGNEISFKTSANPPTLTTTAASLVTSITAFSGGNITSDGGSAITARGVCWGTSSGPTIAGSKTTDAGTTGIFTSSLTSLIAGTTYYVRAYATNSSGTTYGNEISFTTLSTNGIIFNPNLTYGSLTDIDGNIYKTIQIGTQVWTAENLKTTKYNDGTLIPLVTENNAWANLITPGYCWYNNDITNNSTYGALYNWFAVNTTKLCPTGWHVPSDTEFTTLATYLGGGAPAGGKLKEAGTSHWASPNIGATNETGFSALPGGHRYINGNFGSVGDFGFWWSNTNYNSTYSWCVFLCYNYTAINRGNDFSYLQNGFSVRCLRD